MKNMGKCSKSSNIKQIQSKKITSNFPGVTLMKNIILNIHKDTIKWIVSCTTGRNIT